jgi:type VI secretion system protein ImpF
MAKLTQCWSDDLDSVRDAIINNLCGLISCYAPIWPYDSAPDGTIAHIGMKNIARSQSKANSEVIIHEIKGLIHQYEPRLSQVEIEIQGDEKNLLKFRISALMHAPHGDDKLILESFLDLSSNTLNVRSSSLA